MLSDPPAAAQPPARARVIIAPGRVMFGHAFSGHAIELRRRARSRAVLLAHHRPDRTDDALDRFAATLREEPAVALAVQGTVLEL